MSDTLDMVDLGYTWMFDFSCFHKQAHSGCHVGRTVGYNRNTFLNGVVAF
jgi:hypothetical protein